LLVVITLGMEHAREGDTDRTRLFVTPILVYFASLLIISLAMIPPLSETTRALALGVIGCAGLGYTINLAFMLRRLARPEEIEPMWDIGLPIAAYSLLVFSAAAWALKAPFADLSEAAAVAILLIAALRKSWVVTLFIASRKRKDAPDS
jgi:O-antigen/teichoic acid export membrane protein